MYQSFVGKNTQFPQTFSYNPRSAILPSVVTQSLVPQIQPRFGARTLGLVNLGNTCYMSAILEVLFDIFNFPSLSYNKKPVTDAFMRLKSTHSDLDYEQFKEQAGRKIEMVADYDQEDAHQFLCGLLEALNRENQEMKYVSKLNFTIDYNRSVSENWDNFCYQMSKWDNSVVIRILGGELYTELKCPQNHPNYLFERVLNLSLSFSEPSIGEHVQDLLINSFKEQQIDQVMCQKCGFKVEMIKQSFIYNPPNVLILHLKRFRQGYYSSQKIRSPVIFDQILTLNSRYLHPDIRHSSHSYRLFAIVHHRGGLNGGHYYTQKRIANKWFTYDDKRVSDTSISPMRNVSETVYMLVYGKL